MVECNNVATAAHLYEECDGLEFERSSNRYTVRMHMSKVPAKTTCLVLQDMFCGTGQIHPQLSQSRHGSAVTQGRVLLVNVVTNSLGGLGNPDLLWKNGPCSLGRRCEVHHSWCKASLQSVSHKLHMQ